MAELPPSAFEDQENAKTTNLIKRNHTKIDENIPLEIGGKLLGAIGTPKAASTKSLQTNRRVLAEKTPNNGKLYINYLSFLFHLFLILISQETFTIWFKFQKYCNKSNEISVTFEQFDHDTSRTSFFQGHCRCQQESR